MNFVVAHGPRSFLVDGTCARRSKWTVDGTRRVFFAWKGRDSLCEFFLRINWAWAFGYIFTILGLCSCLKESYRSWLKLHNHMKHSLFPAAEIGGSTPCQSFHSWVQFATARILYTFAGVSSSSQPRLCRWHVKPLTLASKAVSCVILPPTLTVFLDSDRLINIWSSFFPSFPHHFPIIFPHGKRGYLGFTGFTVPWPGPQALAGDRDSWSIWAAHLMMKGLELSRDEDLRLKIWGKPTWISHICGWYPLVMTNIAIENGHL